MKGLRAAVAVPGGWLAGGWKGWCRGVLLTVILAVLAGQIARLPLFSVMGVMVISILLGTLWKTAMDVPADAPAGIAFSSKYLLRTGIVLTGLRLDLQQIWQAGTAVIWIDVIVIAFTLAFMLGLGRLLSVERTLSALIAVGTAVCGAAAIAAVAPLIGARKETTALSVAGIAVLGTAGALAYIIAYPHLGLDPYLYGVLAGSTLHELAHVIAAAAPGGDAGGDAAIVVKLGRVALLIPVALVLGHAFRTVRAGGESGTSGAEPERRDAGGRRLAAWRRLPVPWFIFGFLAMSVVKTLDVLPETLVRDLIGLGVFLMSAAMAGLGLGIRFADFRRLGLRAFTAAVIGFAALSGLGFGLIRLFY
jgi:uncharacterized integral membrane protein (TIGR00698 family)